MFKTSLDLSATTDAATTYETPHLHGELRKIRMVIGTMTTKKTITIGVSGESTTIAFASYKMGTTSQNYFPVIGSEGSTGKGTSTQAGLPPMLVDEKIKVYVQATSSGDSRTGTIKFYLDGVYGGTTST